MTNVILFSPICDTIRITFTIPPWALLHVAAPLVEDGYSVSIIDQNVELNWKKRLRSELGEDTLFVGVTAMTGMQIKFCLEFINEAKSLRNVPVVWGGGHASIFPEQTLNHKQVDFVVKGEGEATVREFAQALKSGKGFNGIKGLWYKEDGKIRQNPEREFIDMNQLARMPFELIDVERYIFSTSYAKRNFELCSSRGCPHRCGFCYNVCTNKQKWRCKSAEKVVEELKFLVEKYHIDGLNWREDNFFVDKKRVEAICLGMIREGLNIKWHSDSRIDYFAGYDDDFIELLRQSGCSRITFGVESGSQKVLNIIKKDITVEQVLEVNRKMRKHGIRCMYHFSFGFMGESMDDVRQTVSLADTLLRENPNAGIWPPSMYTPYPGTPLFEESVRRGFKVPQELEQFISLFWAISNLPWISVEQGKKLAKINFVMSGYASGIPLVKQWFGYRFRRLLKTNEPGLMPEKPVVDFVRQLIRESKIVCSKVPQMS
jgi:radical SAM superfamily enzyme YgiQ (UPF0313 family)